MQTGKVSVLEKSVNSASGPRVIKKKKKLEKYFCSITSQQTDVHHLATYCQSQQTHQNATDNLKSGPP